jgi:hypothetical protein
LLDSLMRAIGVTGRTLAGSAIFPMQFPRVITAQSVYITF